MSNHTSHQTTGGNTEFVDVHGGEKLPVTKYLKEEDIQCWNSTHSWYGFAEHPDYKTTKASVEALRRVWYNGWVTICGCSGEGKSYIVSNLVNKLRHEAKKRTTRNNCFEKVDGIAEEGRNKYEIIYISSPDEWKSKMEPDAYQLFVIDDIFGTGCLTVEKLRNWQPLLDDMVVQSSLSNHKLKVIVVFNRAQQREMPSEYERYPIFQSQYVLDLDDYKYKYDKAERIEIFDTYRSCDGDTMDEMYLQNIRSSFPLVVRMYCANTSLSLQGYQYFRNPWKYVEEIIEAVYEFDHIMYYTLAFCVLMDGKVYLNKRQFTDYDSNTQYILNQLRQMISIPDNTDMSMIRFAAKMLDGFFLTTDTNDCEKTIFSHDRIKNLTATSVFRKDSTRFLQLCSLDFICERVRTLNYIETDGVSLNVYSGDYETLVQRYTYEILSGHAKRIASLPCSHDESVIPVWSTFMEDMGSAEDIIRQQDDDGRPFLFWIVHHGCYMLLQFFLETESLEEVRQEEWFKECLQQGFQGTVYSEFKDSPEAVKLLLDYGIKPDQMYPYQEDDIFEVFGFDMGYLIKMQATPIHFAAQNAQPDTVKFLVAAGADINAPAKDGLTPLHRSVLQTDAHTTQALLELKANVDVKSPRGTTPLIEACLRGNKEIAEVLLTAGADTSAVCQTFGSVFRCGVASGNVYLPKFLLENEVPKFNSTDTWSAVHQAILSEDTFMVHTLINFGVSLDSECNGWMPLHLAVVFDSRAMVSRLIDKTCNIESKTSDGKTALHLAAELGYYTMCSMLLSNGASPDAKTDSGLYPLNLAARKNHAMVVKLLLEEGLEVKLPSDIKELFAENSEFLPSDMQGRDGLMGMMKLGQMNPQMMMMMTDHPGYRDMMKNMY